MKNFAPIGKSMVLLVLVALLNINCRKGRGEPEPQVDISCKLLSTTGDALKVSVLYDTQGRLKSVTEGSKTIRAFNYDSQGYLTSAKLYYDSLTFTYKNGLIDKITDREFTQVFGYDARGNLSKIIETRAGQRPTAVTVLFQSDRITEVITEAGGITVRPYQLVIGYVTEILGYEDGYETYQYDAAGRPTRRNYYENGTLLSYEIKTYQDGFDPYSSFPTLKGFPKPFAQAYGFSKLFALTGYPFLETSDIRYIIEDGVERKYFESKKSYTLNACNFPVTMTAEYREFPDDGYPPIVKPSLTTIYTYQNCN